MDKSLNRTIKNINKLIKFTNLEPIESKDQLSPKHWISILHWLFIKNRYEFGTSLEAQIDHFEHLFNLLKQKHPSQFHKLSVEKILLDKDDDQLFDFSHGLIIILKDKFIRKLPIDSPKRVSEALEALQDLIKSVSLQVDFKSFKDFPPDVWILIINNLFYLPDIDSLMDLYSKDPIKALTKLIQALSQKILGCSLDYIDPEKLYKKNIITCTLMSELICELGRAIILQSFEDVRHFSLSEPSTGTSILSGYNQPSISDLDRSSMLITNKRYQFPITKQRTTQNDSFKQSKINSIPEPLRPGPNDSAATKALKLQKIEQYLKSQNL